MTLNVLFIGNSHTYLNFMPQMLLMLANDAASGFELVTEQCTGEGAGLEWHWNNPPSREAIGNRRWDYVVLQDRSGGPLEEPVSFMQHAHLLDGEIKKRGARTILYMTWANRQRPETQAAITEAYTNLATELESWIAPVGMAWEAVQRVVPDFDLYHHDGRHANPAGSYLAACVFYSVLFKATPEGLPGTFSYKGKKRLELTEDRALVLQKTAWETASSIWGIKA